jgi:chemotaxis protein methyltransferase CheR
VIDKDREFDFTKRDFDAIKILVKKLTGIALSDVKKDMVYSRLARRIRHLHLTSFSQYLDLIRDENGPEIGDFINSITTNLTSFFREGHHFEMLAGQVLPELLAARADTQRLRIWSAGCSTGEEPYTIAMVLREAIPRIDSWDIRILATDLDSGVLATAKSGLYAEDRITGIDSKRQRRWFLRGKGQHAGKVRVRPELQDMIVFKQLNLMGDWPMRGVFDVIFCRNVVIYFDKPTQRILFSRYSDVLHDNGFLFVGHSESLYKVTDQFQLLGQTVYRKRVAAMSV